MAADLSAVPRAEWGVSLAETDVDRAVIASLKRWMPTYITQAEREREDLRDHLLARPKDQSYQNSLEDTDFPDGRLPAVVVTTAQASDTTKKPYGHYSADFAVVVSVIARGRTAYEAREVTAIYGACARAVLIHQQTELEGEINLDGFNLVPVPDQLDQGRWLCGSLNRFTLLCDEALTGDGPVDPDPDDPPYPPPDPDDPDGPYAPLGVVTEVVTTITGVPPRS